MLEEIIQALAQQQYDFEKSMNGPFKSPPRSLKKETDYDLESATDCEEYFDAFDDEDDTAKGGCSSKTNLDKQENEEVSKIQESEEFQMIHDLQRVATSLVKR